MLEPWWGGDSSGLELERCVHDEELTVEQLSFFGARLRHLDIIAVGSYH